jgi:hypothetical protein
MGKGDFFFMQSTAATNRHKPYWATVDVKEIADNMLEKVDTYYKFLSMSGRMDLYRRSWLYFYRPRVTGGRINPTGEQGELTAISVNHYRNLLSHLETMTTQQRPAFEPRATNTDAKSQSQVILATGLLDYYMREKKMERYIKQGVKDALLYGEGFVRCEWDATSGEKYGKTESGATVYQGDMKYSNFTPFNCIRDFTKESAGQDEWVILREAVNKYTLAAKFPELADDILDDSVDLLEYAATTTLQAIGLDESDNVFKYTLLHGPTPAVPEGRYTTCLDNGTVMEDGPLPYTETHVYRITPDEESGTIFGYTVGFDLLPVQECIDILYSTVVTNQSTFGVQNILAPKGHDLSTSQLSGGLNLMEYDPAIGKPEAMNLTSTPPEIFNFIGMLERVSETLSGVNSVARGNPEASLKSGAALALVQSMAIQFSQNLQQSYARLVEDVGTGTIKILQTYASVPRVAAIAGKSNRPLMKEFTGEDLDGINRVMVDMGNPLTRTTAGKVNLADALAERNMIDNPDQYIQVVTTGRLEPVIEGKQAELLLIKSENEELADGKPQIAIVTDRHDQHILEHKTVLANPDVRRDPQSTAILQATLNHIQEHVNFLKTTDPVLLQLLKEQSFAPPPAPPQGAASPGQMLNAQNPVTQQAANVKQPNMPQPPHGTDPNSAAIIQGGGVPQSA